MCNSAADVYLRNEPHWRDMSPHELMCDKLAPGSSPKSSGAKPAGMTMLVTAEWPRLRTSKPQAEDINYCSMLVAKCRLLAPRKHLLALSDSSLRLFAFSFWTSI